MTPGAWVLVVGSVYICYIVKNHYFFKNLILFSKRQNRQSKYTGMMTNQGSTKVVNFMTPSWIRGSLLGHGHLSQIVKIHYFFKNLLLYSKAQIRKTEGIVMMSEEESTKIVNFMTPRAGILVLGRGLIVNMQYFFSSSCLHQGMDQTN